ncbi:MAG: BT_2262 family domain-containing protein [Rikenellaceae bacterium]
MISSEVIDATDTNVIPEMKHVGAAAALNIRYENLGEKEYFLTGVKIGEIPVVVMVNLLTDVDHEEFIIDDGWDDFGTSTILIEEPIAASAVDTEVRFNIFPFTIAPGDGLDIILSFEDAEGATYSLAKTISNNTADDIEFKRATYNNINCSCDIEELTEGEIFTLDAFSSTNYPFGTTWVIADSSASYSDFYGLQTALSNFEAGTISLEFPNLETLPDACLWGKSAVKSISLPVATTIETCALLYCYYMTDIYMPNVTSIEQEAFCFCSALNNVEVSKDIEFIGGGAFAACDALTDITIDSPLFALEDGIIYGLDDAGTKTSLICALITLAKGELYSDTVLSVEPWALEYCEFTSVDLPAATTLQLYAFAACPATEINLPSVTTIYDYAFYFYDYPAYNTERTINLATGEGVEISYVGNEVFDSSPYITLIVGAQNGKYVSENTFTAQQISYEFNSIETPTGQTFDPLITLSGTGYKANLGETFVDPGEYTATDLDGTDITDKVVVDLSAVDFNTFGTYIITYSVDSAFGYTSYATRGITVSYTDPDMPYISGIYTVQEGSYRDYGGGNLTYFSGQTVTVRHDGPGEIYVSDLIGGYYDQYVGYGSLYAMIGYIDITDNNTVKLQSSYLSGWGDSLDSMSNGTYDPETGKLYWEVSYVDGLMNFYITLKK